jgi:hypothetical protein
MAMYLMLRVATTRLLSLGSQDGHCYEERKARFGPR